MEPPARGGLPTPEDVTPAGVYRRRLALSVACTSHYSMKLAYPFALKRTAGLRLVDRCAQVTSQCEGAPIQGQV